MKTFVIGDIHGAYRALLQCFERSRFDYNKDRLVVIGDVCDGYPDVVECFDELLKIVNLVYICLMLTQRSAACQLPIWRY